MLYFTRWKAIAILLTAFVVCLCAVPNFIPAKIVDCLAEMGAAPRRARPRSAGRLAPPARGRHQGGAEGNAGDAARRRAPRAARGARRLYRARGARQQRRGAHPRGLRFRCRADQAARIVGAARRHSRRHRAAQPRRRHRRRQSGAADADRAGDRRARASVGRAVDPDHRAARQRARHRGAADPARGHRPHSRAGAGSAGPDPPQGSCSARPPSSTSAWSTPTCRRSRCSPGRSRRTTKSSTAPARRRSLT